MRRIPLILGLVLITGLIIHDVYEFFVTNEGVRYFSSDPRRLIYVLLLGVAGGVIAIGISRLSPGSQRTLKLAALGTCGTALVSGLGVFAYHLARLLPMIREPMVREAGTWGLAAAVLGFLSFAVVAVLVWLEFRQIWRQA
jgi:hypothetical protein